MKGSISNQILIYLYYEDAINDDLIEITDFLKSLQNEDAKNDEEIWNNFNRIKNAIEKITLKQFATFSYRPEGILGENKLGRTCRLENTEVRVKFHLSGFEYIRNFIRENEQHNSILETNKSVIESNRLSGIVNTSITELNTKTKGYYTQLKWATWIIAGATLIGMIFSILTFVEAYEHIYTKLEFQPETLQLLKESLTIQQGIDSSLRTMAKDTFVLKGHLK